MMLVECTTTSTNNASLSLPTTTTTITTSCSNGIAATTSCCNTTILTTMTSTVLASIVATTSSNMSTCTTVVAQAKLNILDDLSSGSNSIGNSVNTNSNSISNSNSIGNSWKVGSVAKNSSGDQCNGRETNLDQNCDLMTECSNSTRGHPETGHVQKSKVEYAIGNTVNKMQSNSTYYCKNTSLSDYKYNREHNKTGGEPNRGKNMVDVEACLANTPPHLLIRSLSSLSHHSSHLSTLPRSPEQEQVGSQTLQKGVLQQARDRLFSRWKERYFVLTRDYLACFRRGSTKYSEMGSFIFKVNLASVEGVWWEERRGGAVVAVALPREGRVLLRPRASDMEDNLQVWHRALVDATTASRLRRSALRRGTSTTHLHVNATTLPLPSPSGTSVNGSSSSECGGDDSLTGCSTAVPSSSYSHHRPTSSLETDPPSTPPSSITSSHKFSTTTSSGSGCGSSVASSPGLGTGSYHPPGGWSPRSRFSLVESPRRLLQSSATAICPPKTRHSLCLEPHDLPGPGTRLSGAGRLCSSPRSPGVLGTPLSLSSTPTGSRACFPPTRRFTPSPAGHSRRSLCLDSLSASRTSLLSLTPRNPLLELLENSPPPTGSAQDGDEAAPALTHALVQPRSRANLTLFRNSPLFN